MDISFSLTLNTRGLPRFSGWQVTVLLSLLMPVHSSFQASPIRMPVSFKSCNDVATWHHNRWPSCRFLPQAAWMEVSLRICSVAEPTKAPLSLQSSGIKQLCFVARAQLGSRQDKHVATSTLWTWPNCLLHSNHCGNSHSDNCGILHHTWKETFSNFSIAMHARNGSLIDRSGDSFIVTNCDYKL